MPKVELREPFIGPPILYALAFDTIDFVGNVVSAILTLAAGTGLGIDAGVDAIQGVGALIVFRDPKYAFIPTAVDFMLPPVLDVFPAFTAYVIYDEYIAR